MVNVMSSPKLMSKACFAVFVNLWKRTSRNGRKGNLDADRVRAYWRSYLDTLPPESPVRDEEYIAEGSPLPETALKTIVLDGNGDPLCIVETTEVEVRPYDKVDARFAYEEGEGDRSLEFWRGAHWRFFSRTLPNIGKEPATDMPLVCERFRVVYRETKVMETREITIRVDADAAKAYTAASPEVREKVDLLLSLRLSQVTGPLAPLEQVMREISEAAQKRGLTEERLSEILREE